MLVLLLIGCRAAHAAGPAESKPFFTPCVEALATEPFAPLREVIPSGLRASAGCMRLDDREYLLFQQPYGPATPFHYCDLRVPVPMCEALPHFFYSFEPVRQFTGAGGKRFLLWSNSQMKRGIVNGGYGIFSLVPKSVDPRGFAIYPLAGETRFLGETSGEQPCYLLEGEATELMGYELVGEGTRGVELRFPQKITDCATNEETMRRLAYRLKNGKFELVP